MPPRRRTTKSDASPPAAETARSLDRVRGEARLREDAGAAARGVTRAVGGRAAHLRRPAAPRHAHALRPAPRGWRRDALVAGAARALARPGRAAARDPDGGPPARLRLLRGRDPEGRVRRGRGDRLGQRQLLPRRGRRALLPRPRRGRGARPRWHRARQALRHLPRPQAEGLVGARADQRRGAQLAAAQAPRRGRRPLTRPHRRGLFRDLRPHDRRSAGGAATRPGAAGHAARPRGAVPRRARRAAAHARADAGRPRRRAVRQPGLALRAEARRHPRPRLHRGWRGDTALAARPRRQLRSTRPSRRRSPHNRCRAGSSTARSSRSTSGERPRSSACSSA